MAEQDVSRVPEVPNFAEVHDMKLSLMDLVRIEGATKAFDARMQGYTRELRSALEGLAPEQRRLRRKEFFSRVPVIGKIINRS